MPASIGVNLRVTGHSSQGGRKYMEDFFSVAYQQSDDKKDLEYAFFGIYDGHGGSEAAAFAKEHLLNLIVGQKLFWSDNDDDILRGIREGYIATHYAMWREQDKWPKTATGLPSTAGTTASIAFIRHGKIYIGHVGDSGIVLGYQEEGELKWRAQPLTQDHKPECNVEKARIYNSGGKVITKSGVPRVVWNRPKIGHKGPVRRSTLIDEIPFLAVARSLGDLWSYNSEVNEFIVSPVPDLHVIKIDPKKFRCLIFGTDGLWNVITPSAATELIRSVEIMNDRNTYYGKTKDCNMKGWVNPSKYLVDEALDRWSKTKMRADNTSVVTIMLDPPGPPKTNVLRYCSNEYKYPVDQFKESTNDIIPDLNSHSEDMMNEAPKLGYEPIPLNGLHIMTRYNDYQSTESHTDLYNNYGGSSSVQLQEGYSNYEVLDSYDVNNCYESDILTDLVTVNSIESNNWKHDQNLSEDSENNMETEDVEDTYELTNLQTIAEQIRDRSCYYVKNEIDDSYSGANLIQKYIRENDSSVLEYDYEKFFNRSTKCILNDDYCEGSSSSMANSQIPMDGHNAYEVISSICSNTQVNEITSSNLENILTPDVSDDDHVKEDIAKENQSVIGLTTKVKSYSTRSKNIDIDPSKISEKVFVNGNRASPTDELHSISKSKLCCRNIRSATNQIDKNINIVQMSLRSNRGYKRKFKNKIDYQKRLKRTVQKKVGNYSKNNDLLVPSSSKLNSNRCTTRNHGTKSIPISISESITRRKVTRSTTNSQSISMEKKRMSISVSTTKSCSRKVLSKLV